MDPQAWQLLAIFCTCVAGLIVEPLPVPVWAFLCLTMAVVSKTLTWQVALSGFTNDVIWLITVSFFFARGIVQSGLGVRIAQSFVAAFGKSTLGLSYCLTTAEAFMAMAMPSNTARAGGVFLPVIKSLSEEAGSTPEHKPQRLGRFLAMSQCHGAAQHSSNLFVTGAAQNLMCLKLAEEAGIVLVNPFMQWFSAACMPCLACLFVAPYAMYKLCPPDIKETPEAPAAARRKLEALGPLSQGECVMLLAMAAATVVWVCGFGLPGATGAMLGLSILLSTGVLSWQDCLAESSAWSTITWFSVLVGFSGALNQMGLDWMANNVSASVVGLGLPVWGSIGVLLAAYFLAHYLFASQTAHVASLFSAFLAMIIMAGGGSVFSALLLAFTTNLFGSISHYASGSSVVFYNAGYISLRDFWVLGAKMAVINTSVFFAVALPWWWCLGLF